MVIGNRKLWSCGRKGRRERGRFLGGGKESRDFHCTRRICHGIAISGGSLRLMPPTVRPSTPLSPLISTLFCTLRPSVSLVPVSDCIMKNHLFIPLKYSLSICLLLVFFPPFLFHCLLFPLSSLSVFWLLILWLFYFDQSLLNHFTSFNFLSLRPFYLKFPRC